MECFPLYLSGILSLPQCAHGFAVPRSDSNPAGVVRITLGVVTTKEPEQAEIVLRRLGLNSFFKHIQSPAGDLRAKPAPDTVLAALAALHCIPSQALMVGDTPADMLAGKAAGVRTCAVTYGFGSREALSGCAPDAVIDSFGELLRVLRELKR